jgi:hypothetical protein
MCRRARSGYDDGRKPAFVSNAQKLVSSLFGEGAEIVSYMRNDVLCFPSLSSLLRVFFFCLFRMIFNAMETIIVSGWDCPYSNSFIG